MHHEERKNNGETVLREAIVETLNMICLLNADNVIMELIKVQNKR